MARVSSSQRQATHAALIDAFVDLMHEAGVEGTTVTAVSARAGLARSAFYNYFADIPALFHAAMAREIEMFAAERRAEVERVADPTERLETFISGCLAAFRQHSSPLDVEPALGLNHQIHVEQQIEPLRQLLGEILRAGVDEGVFRSEAASSVVVEMVMHAVNSQRLPIVSGTTDPADVRSTMVATLLAAVRSEPAAT